MKGGVSLGWRVWIFDIICPAFADALFAIFIPFIPIYLLLLVGFITGHASSPPKASRDEVMFVTAALYAEAFRHQLTVGIKKESERVVLFFLLVMVVISSVCAVLAILPDFLSDVRLSAIATSANFIFLANSIYIFAFVLFFVMHFSFKFEAMLSLVRAKSPICDVVE